jgi:hypothetical protein
LFAFSLSKEFYVPREGNNNYKAWDDYRDAIEKYLEGVCANVRAKDPATSSVRSFKEELKRFYLMKYIISISSSSHLGRV